MAEYRKLMNSSTFQNFDSREFVCGWSAGKTSDFFPQTEKSQSKVPPYQ